MHERYSRQVLLQEIGAEGQLLLQRKKVAIVGIGALGTVSSELLARAGVGSLLLVDRDVIEESNLQRQVLFDEDDLGKSKAAAAREKLEKINQHILIETKAIHLNNKNIGFLKEMDLVLDCTDNLETRFLINEFCKKEQIPWIYAAAIRTSGYVMPIMPAGACLRCFLDTANLETCDTVGVLNTATVSIAALQTTLALKMLLHKEVEPVLYHYDLWDGLFRKIKINKKSNCPACTGKYEHLENIQNQTIRFCSAGKFQVSGTKIDWERIKKDWQRISDVVDDGVTLRFKNIMLFKDGRALIDAKSVEEAEAVYSRMVGN